MNEIQLQVSDRVKIKESAKNRERHYFNDSLDGIYQIQSIYNSSWGETAIFSHKDLDYIPNNNPWFFTDDLEYAGKEVIE